MHIEVEWFFEYYVGISGESEFEDHPKSSQFQTKSRDCQVLSSRALFVTLGGRFRAVPVMHD